MTGTPAWRSMLNDAISKPGRVHEAYRFFHGYSVRNMLLALAQCDDRGLMPGPLATFKRWQQVGRQVRLGEKALSLCVPLTHVHEGQEEAHDQQQDAVARPRFVYRARWFVLGQTEGKPYEAVSLPSWNEESALQALGIKRVEFDHLNGNVQGYSVRRNVAIAPSPSHHRVASTG